MKTIQDCVEAVVSAEWMYNVRVDQKKEKALDAAAKRGDYQTVWQIATTIIEEIKAGREPIMPPPPPLGEPPPEIQELGTPAQCVCGQVLIPVLFTGRVVVCPCGRKYETRLS